MADRASANVFGTIFKLLAKNPRQEHREIAKTIYPMISDWDDFNFAPRDFTEASF